MAEQKSRTAAMEHALRGVWYAHVSKEIQKRDIQHRKETQKRDLENKETAKGDIEIGMTKEWHGRHRRDSRWCETCGIHDMFQKRTRKET